MQSNDMQHDLTWPYLSWTYPWPEVSIYCLFELMPYLHHLKRFDERNTMESKLFLFFCILFRSCQIIFLAPSCYSRRDGSSGVFFFTSKGQLAILPQLKVTWWLRSHQVGHVALSHIIRSALTRRERWRFSFLDIFILTWDMVKRKMALMTSLWRHVYFDDVKTPFKIFC